MLPEMLQAKLLAIEKSQAFKESLILRELGHRKDVMLERLHLETESIIDSLGEAADKKVKTGL